MLTIKDRADPTAEGEQTVGYPENGTGSVATFTASDPEGASPIVWSLEEGADAGDFTINGGVLNFKGLPRLRKRPAAAAILVRLEHDTWSPCRPLSETR